MPTAAGLFGRVAGSTVLAGVAALAYARCEAEMFTLRRVTVPVLPAGARDMTVLHVSDLHLTPRQRRKIAWVRELADLAPDFVVDTGDNMAHLDVLPDLLHALEPLMAFPGAFVMGSNDYYSPHRKNPANYLLKDPRPPRVPRKPDLPAAKLAAALAEAGWIDLDNNRARAVIGGLDVALVGMDDPHIDRDRMPPADPATSSAELRLGVVHAPYVRALEALRADGSDLIIAGHTHGGQLCVPGFGALVTNCDLDRGRAKGLHGWPGARPDEFGGHDSTWLHVSGGLGTSPYTPVRFACRPSATLLTLTAR